jgi:hypothetical protein
MSSKSTAQTNTITQFPIEITKEITFIAKTQADLDYLNSTKSEDDFRVDIKECFADIVELEIVAIDGAKVD